MGLDAELWQAAECNDIDKVGFFFFYFMRKINFMCNDIDKVGFFVCAWKKAFFWFFVQKTSVGDIDKVGVDFFLCLVTNICR